MYMITEMLDGRWIGIYQIQDRTESFEENTKNKAIQKMIYSVRIMNHMDITEADIEFVEENEVKVEGISVTKEDARMQTIDVLVGAIDDLHFANLKLRVSLDSIEHSLCIHDCNRIAKEALR